MSPFVREGGGLQERGLAGLDRFLLDFVELLPAQSKILFESNPPHADFAIAFTGPSGAIMGTVPLRGGLQ